MARQMIEADLSRSRVFRLWGLHRTTSWRWAKRHAWVAQAWRFAELKRWEARDDRRIDGRLRRALYTDPYRNGRPSTYRPDVVDQVRSSNVAQLARAIRRPRRTVRGWVRKHPDLRRALAREALREARERLEQLKYEINAYGR